MPSRNRLKAYVADAYYHVYNRGLNKQSIFLDNQDYAVFLNLLKRYLSKTVESDRKGRAYETLNNEIELLAFCLMPNHFHLLVYQRKPDAMTKLLQRLGTSYTMYFNKKYEHSGPLFQERFKASLVLRDDYLQHISRYIHLNAKGYRTWEFSSIDYFLGNKQAEWVKPNRILKLFESKKEYEQFLKDYEGQKKILDEIKSELANDI